MLRFAMGFQRRAYFSARAGAIAKRPQGQIARWPGGFASGKAQIKQTTPKALGRRWPLLIIIAKKEITPRA
jgi:hypothetical protein